jgi:RNA processing factor Prp31
MTAEPLDPAAAVMADRFIRSHDTATELRQFAYKVRDLARERDRLAADLAAERDKVRRAVAALAGPEAALRRISTASAALSDKGAP